MDRPSAADRPGRFDDLPPPLGALPRPPLPASRGGTAALALVIAAAVLVPSPAPVAERHPCMEHSTLEDVVACVAARMPGRDDGSLPDPAPAERGAWKTLVQRVLDGACGPGARPSALADVYEVAPFRDAVDGGTYCVAIEMGAGAAGGAADDAGRGSPDRASSPAGRPLLVVRQGPARPLAVQVPHPLHDVGTADQGVAVLRDAQARSMLVAGAHRDADPRPSPCQPAHRRSDAAHACDGLFQAAVEAHLEHYAAAPNDGDDGDDGGGSGGGAAPPSWAALQLHGMETASCRGVDVYLSDGTGDGLPAGWPAAELLDALGAAHPDWRVHASGDDADCDLAGTTNVQGRLLNDVPADRVGQQAADGSTGRFVHVEQAPGFRDPDAWTAAVVRAADAVWGPVAP